MRWISQATTLDLRFSAQPLLPEGELLPVGLKFSLPWQLPDALCAREMLPPPGLQGNGL